MAMTPEQNQQDQTDFGAAYDEEMQAPAQQTDDDAFGLTPDAEVMETEDDGIPNSPEEATEAVDETPVEESVTTAAPVQQPMQQPMTGQAGENVGMHQGIETAAIDG